MAENSKIQWTDHTFNPWRGCTKVAAGCVNCYAETLSKRNPGTLGEWGPNGTRVLASESMWREPGKWDRLADEDRSRVANCEYCSEREFDGCEHCQGPWARPRVFCASLADVFEDWPGAIRYPNGTSVPPAIVSLDDVRARLFRLIDATPNLDWLLLTKRPANMRRMWPTEDDGAGGKLAEAIFGGKGRLIYRRPNVWLGTSIANQEDADRNVPELLKCRDLAAKLFVSVEPLVGPVVLPKTVSICPNCGKPPNETGLRGSRDQPFAYYCSRASCCDQYPLPSLDWVIVGGESGPHARPCNVDWVRSIVRQCQEAGVPCFVKQLGARPIEGGDFAAKTGPMEGLRLQDPKGGDPSEWPEDLRVREFPGIAVA